jgi:hypothetical protein
MICAACCHWALPLTIPPRKTPLGFVVPLRFEEWLAYHLHVTTHQGGLKTEPVDFAELFPPEPVGILNATA